MALGKFKDTLRRPGFRPLLATQSLGAFNDNLFKTVVSLLAADLALGAGGAGGALSVVTAVYLLPFFLFSGYAGRLADAFSKRTVLIAAKSFEVVAMALGFFAFRSGRLVPMLAALFLVALHSAFFSPAKYGIVPEMLPEKELSRANGLMEMTTFLAILLGTSLGGVLFAAWRGSLERVAAVMFLIALAGTAASLAIARVPASGAARTFSLNPWSEIRRGVKRLRADPILWPAVVGISYFWFLGVLLQLDLILLGKEVLGLDDLHVGLLLAFLALGIGAGSLAAGRLSGDKVELGLVPLGSLGMGVFSLLLYFAAGSFAGAAAALFLIAFSGGLFAVPLNALVQQRSGLQEKGLLLAANNFINMAAMLLAAGAFWLLRGVLKLEADTIVLSAGLFTLAATVYILAVLPDFLIRFTLWLVTHTIYRIRIAGQEHVPFRGPALLVSNHLSYVDALLVGASVQRFIRFLVYRPYYESPWLHWLFRLMKAIPVSAGSRRDIVASLARARAELSEGHVVCIFPEGAISRTGNLLPFKRGLEKIVEGMDVPVIPVHLDRLWGSIFSFKDGRFFWKRPERLPYPVAISFGPPLPAPATAREARQAVSELASAAVERRRAPRDLLPLRFFKTAKRNWFSFCMADSSGQELTFGGAAAASLLLARWIGKKCPGESMVGLLLPASAGGALANIAALTAGKAPVNLNFTAGREATAHAVRQCGIRTIVTSRRFLARAKLDETAGMVYLEDAAGGFRRWEKIAAALAAFALPARLLVRLSGGGARDARSLATVVFSSGSTGVPKGVMLSHHNVLSNIEAIGQVFRTGARDRMLGVLPFFHSFGFTGTLWFPLVSGFGAAYHPNPLDAKTIGEMAAKHKATILISTPTFYAAYLKRIPPEQFAALRYAVAGAEKLREPVAAAFKEKYGVDLLEGYGATETAPVIAVNVPDVDEADEHQIGRKPGTVGHPLPGVSVKVVEPESGAPLAPGREGLLLVKGPNLMAGYLGEPEKTAAVLCDGWYATGDIAALDEDGFIRITDRLARFSKIGGEMVPHLKVEEAVDAILGGACAVVVALPDEQKGERLAVLYAHAGFTPAELWDRLRETALPKLWIPRRENCHRVESIPLLGTGKVDLAKVKMLAVEYAEGSSA